jgi:hypothetical protein
MGRGKNDGLQDSDDALDYQATITDRFERELAFWISPEKVFNTGWWLARVLAVIEGILLLAQRDERSSVFLEEPKAVKRWRDVFLNVWDDNQTRERQYSNIFDDPAYLQQHRPAIVVIFDRLENIAHEWINPIGPVDLQLLPPLLPDYPLPYFSIYRRIIQGDKEVTGVERFTSDLLESLVKDIIYHLSPEKRSEALAFNVEAVWVAVDMLGFLCKAYEQSPGINEQTVRNWRTTTIEIDKQFTGESWDESDKLTLEIIAAFDRLEAMAKKYPPQEW